MVFDKSWFSFGAQLEPMQFFTFPSEIRNGAVLEVGHVGAVVAHLVPAVAFSQMRVFSSN